MAKYGRRECEICEKRVTNLREVKGLGLVGDCPEHGEIPAWITGCRQLWLDKQWLDENA